MRKSFYKVIVATLLLASCSPSMYLKNGKQAYEGYRYQDAISYFNKGLAKKEDASSRMMLANSYLKVNNFNSAISNYELASTAPDITDNDRINRAKALMGAQRYTEAMPLLEGVLSRSPENTQARGLLESCKSIEKLKDDSTYYVIESLNIPIGGPFFSSTPYNGGLIITSPSGEGEKDPYNGLTYNNLYFSKRDGASWTTPEPLAEVNGIYHDACAAVSPAGTSLIFTRSFQVDAGKMGKNDIPISTTQLYSCTKGSDGKWSKPTLIPFCDASSMYAHPSFSPDGLTLYFSSDMSGSYGGMDLWSSKFIDGSWGTPVNLGKNVNSTGNELFPVVRSADQIYFSSDGHQCLGGIDILYSYLRNGIWEKPVHQSYPVNTPFDDFGMVWNGDGKSGYLSSDRMGSDKVFSFSYDDSKVTLMGSISGKDSNLPLGGVKVFIKNLTDGTEQMILTDGDGRFQAELIRGKDYQIVTELEGYFALNENIETRNVENPIVKNFKLTEVYVTDATKDEGKDSGNGKNKGVYPMPDIHWDFNKWQIRKDAYPFLDELVKLFRENDNLKFELRSHTDCRGSQEYNDQLSDKRAKAVTEYLVKKGVPRAIITSKGFGERELLNDCKDGVKCSEAKHEENRRTEFIVNGKKIK